MLGVGHKFPAYSLQATVSLEKGKAFQTISNRGFQGQVEGLLLLAQGLHLRVPHRNRRIR